MKAFVVGFIIGTVFWLVKLFKTKRKEKKVNEKINFLG